MAACPDPGLIAAHVDHRLGGDEAARMDEHIAGCPDCYDVFSQTVQFALAEAEAALRDLTARLSAAQPVAAIAYSTQNSITPSLSWNAHSYGVHRGAKDCRCISSAIRSGDHWFSPFRSCRFAGPLRS
jgi:hypothetical protein